MKEIFPKDPDAVLDFSFDWRDWLDDTVSPPETISSYTITVSADLTKDSDSRSGGIITVWISGGTASKVNTVACEIVTSEGRTDERTAHIRMLNR